MRLWLLSLVLVGGYWAYDVPAAMPAALQQHLQQDARSFAYTLNGLYSVYYVPATVAPVLLGVMVPRVGVGVAVAWQAHATLVGAVIFSLGLGVNSLTLILLGRDEGC